MNEHDLNLLKAPFLFSENDIRTALDEAGNPWFCARDICLALDILWSGGSKSLGNMPENWQGAVYYPTPGGRQETIFVNEAGLYKLIFRSNKPKAEEFANWVCEEVLPSIRKTGGYGVGKAVDLLACHKAIHAFLDDLMKTKSVVKREMLIASLQTLCTMAGIKMPELTRLPLKIDQADLFEGGDK